MLNDDFQGEDKIEAIENDDDSVDQLMRSSADGLCRKLDDPEELRRWFDRVVEIIERGEREEGDVLPEESAEDGLDWA